MNEPIQSGDWVQIKYLIDGTVCQHNCPSHAPSSHDEKAQYDRLITKVREGYSSGGGGYIELDDGINYWYENELTRLGKAITFLN